jgi:1,4-dihydroxy-2-naphthoate octaprenyltransferase
MGLASLLPFGLANALLLLNQFPDVEADRRAGRRTLPMVLGKVRAWPVLAAQYLLAYGALLAAVAARGVPPAALLGLLTLPLAAKTVHRAARHANDTPALLPAMRANVLVSLATPALAAAGLAWGA